MPYTDRTEEFSSIINRKTIKNNKEIKREGVYSKSQIILNDINETTELLNKLVKIIKKKTIFDDESCQISKLTRILKIKLEGHKKEILLLENNKENNNSQYEKNSKLIINSLQNNLNYIFENYKIILNKRNISLKIQNEREDKYSGNDLKRNSIKLIKNKLNPEIQLQQYKQLNNEETRLNEIKDIENNLIEVSDMYIKLGELVFEQGELIKRIDNNIEYSLDNVENSQEELLNWYKKISNNRGLILKIFTVLIVFTLLTGIVLI